MSRPHCFGWPLCVPPLVNGDHIQAMHAAQLEWVCMYVCSTGAGQPAGAWVSGVIPKATFHSRSAIQTCDRRGRADRPPAATARTRLTRGRSRGRRQAISKRWQACRRAQSRRNSHWPRRSGAQYGARVHRWKRPSTPLAPVRTCCGGGRGATRSSSLSSRPARPALPRQLSLT